ncbi:MAG: hypothetical protein HY717_21955 [Planctomycetes bacterium]|nr:hypothetical protein [Planctomycetota bacterium]
MTPVHPRRSGVSVPAFLALAFLPGVSTTPGAEAEESWSVVWEIGKLDDSPREFALGEREEYSRFQAKFPEEVRFAAGKDSPSSFPYIHPGPKDQWAGAKAHAFTLTFDLPADPSGTYVLLVDLCRSHYEFPPALELEANGEKLEEFKTARDGRDQQKFVRIPSSALRRGANEIRIENSSGSWAVYDGLRLERFPPGWAVEHLGGFRLKDSLFFREVEGKLHQVIRAEVDGFWDGKGKFVLRGPDLEKEFPAESVFLRPGAYELPIPEPRGQASYTCELVTAGGARLGSKVDVTPHRQWTVYAALKTHYDLGYAHPLDEMLRNAAGPMLSKILQHCEETRNFPPEQRFRWTYPTWVLGKLRRLLGEKEVEHFDAAIERGDLGWNAAPFTLHSYFCGIEDMVRAFYPSAKLEKKYGKVVRWVKQTDVPGHTRFLPEVLARSGIRLLQIGANFGVRGERAPLLFYWEGPDGSRVLTQLTDGYGWGFDEGRLLALERDQGYPYDAFLALYVTGDNVGPADLIEVAKMARSFAERYAYPRIRIGPLEEFVEAIEARFKEKVPVVKNELTDWWIHGVASMAREVSLARQARELLPAAEKLWSSASLSGSARPYPAADLEVAYEQSLLFSEHTWGMAGFKPEPQPPQKRDLETNQKEDYVQMRRSWEVKGDEARAAKSIAERAARAGLEALGETLGIPPGSILVFNPLNWARSDLVRLPKGDLEGVPKAIRDSSSGKEAPWQNDGEDIVFLARDVPPVGYATFVVEPNGKPEPVPSDPGSAPGGIIENHRYRVSFDSTSGAVRSLVDRESGEELTDPEAPFLLGQYVYEGMDKVEGAGWHGSPYQGKGTGRIVPRVARTWRQDGPVFQRLVAEGSLPIENFPYEIGSTDRVIQMVTLPKELDWIECEVRLHGKRPTALVEQGNVAFPFKVKEGKFRLELLGSVVDPARDLQEMGNHDAFAVQHWVDVSGPSAGVTWSPIDTTIVTLGDFRLFRWDPAYIPQNTRIYANCLNNGWSTNFQEWQGGDFRFRFRLRSHRGDWIEGGAARFGREAAQPLLAARVPGQAQGAGKPSAGAAARPAGRGSLLAAEARHAVLINFKRAEDGDGFILRFHNQAPREDSVRISIPGRAIRSAERVLATEKPMPAAASAGAKPGIELKDGSFTLPIGPFALETVRVRL